MSEAGYAVDLPDLPRQQPAVIADEPVGVNAAIAAALTRWVGSMPALIVAGQYAGFGVILAVARAAAAGLRIVPDRWIGLLGLGVWGLWRQSGTDGASRTP